ARAAARSSADEGDLRRSHPRALDEGAALVETRARAACLLAWPLGGASRIVATPAARSRARRDRGLAVGAARRVASRVAADRRVQAPERARLSARLRSSLSHTRRSSRPQPRREDARVLGRPRQRLGSARPPERDRAMDAAHRLRGGPSARRTADRALANI